MRALVAVAEALNAAGATLALLRVGTAATRGAAEGVHRGPSLESDDDLCVLLKSRLSGKGSSGNRAGTRRLATEVLVGNVVRYRVA